MMLRSEASAGRIAFAAAGIAVLLGAPLALNLITILEITLYAVLAILALSLAFV